LERNLFRRFAKIAEVAKPGSRGIEESLPCGGTTETTAAGPIIIATVNRHCAYLLEGNVQIRKGTELADDPEQVAGLRDYRRERFAPLPAILQVATSLLGVGCGLMTGYCPGRLVELIKYGRTSNEMQGCPTREKET
jgi:hypothetical protein